MSLSLGPVDSVCVVIFAVLYTVLSLTSLALPSPGENHHCHSFKLMEISSMKNASRGICFAKEIYPFLLYFMLP